MLQHTSEHAVLQYVMSAGDLYTCEAEVLGSAIRQIAAARQPVTNKAIILNLIKQIEHTTDVVKQDVLRQTLELVVGHTPDDGDFFG